MIVLAHPNQKCTFTLRGLRDNYFAPVEVTELRCEECGSANANGVSTLIYKRSLSDTMVFRINRYSDEGRRSDAIILDEKLRNDGQYCYQISYLIFQHQYRPLFSL